jgi:lipooligosaccharide transport system permease protein
MSGPVLLLRVVPPILRRSDRAHRMIERSLYVNKMSWMIIVSGFFEPLFYLFSIRIGFGSLVGDVTFAGRSIEYAQFVAPALMASSAMNGAVYDSTMNIYFKLRHARLYDGILATPMSSRDVAVGEIGWALTRGTLYSIVFLGCLVALGLTDTWAVVFAVPACLLLGAACASVGMAATTFMRSWEDFDWVQTIVLPMFLFSATFYPLSSYGDWGWLVQISPLYHGVALVRAASLGIATWGIVVHVTYLLVLTVVGLTVAARRVDTLLCK